jgi:hypothetical protein
MNYCPSFTFRNQLTSTITIDLMITIASIPFIIGVDFILCSLGLLFALVPCLLL